MSDLYKTPESDLVQEEEVGPIPKLGYLVLLIFVLEAMSTIAINLSSAYGSEPINIYSLEMAIVAACTVFILWSVYGITVEGKKTITTWLYILIAIILISDGQNVVKYGLSFNFPEILIVLNLALLFLAFYLVKGPLKYWYCR